MKFIVLAVVIAVVAGEAPPHVGLSGYSNGGSNGGSGINEYVDEALLARVGDLIARGGDGSGTPQGTEGLNLDQDIIARVSGSLNDGGSSNGPSPAYGVPSRSSGPAMLGQPEAAERIAEFDLEASSGSSGNQGYDSAPAPAPAPGPQYGAPIRGAAPSGNFGGSRSSGSISLGRPEPAQRVADFSVNGGSNGGSSRGPSFNGGYN